MKIMVFDTETTRLPLWKEPSEHPGQPHLCQFTAVLVDGLSGQELDYVDMLIRPDGWTIPDEVSKIHGISQARALEEGLPEKAAVSQFLRLTGEADLVVGFGVAFDMRIMRIAMLRAGVSKAACDLLMSDMQTRCVMQQATPIAKIPPTDKMMATGRKTFKQPNLGEAVRAILGEEMDDAHDARVDVLYTVRLYFHLNPPAQRAPALVEA